MQEIWVPPAQKKRDLEARREHEGLLQEQLVRHAHMEEWNKEVRRIDPYLEIVWAPANASEIGGIKPNRYCLLRHNPTAPPTVRPLEIDGEYADLGSWVFDVIRSSDLWRDEVVRDRKRNEQQLERQKERREAREREERQEEIGERLHAFDPGVSFANQGKGWRYRASAPRRS